MMDDAKLIRETTARLIDWCAEVRRPLPWRLSPTPYHVWVSEIMLQQTRIEAVIPYYARFLEALPDIRALAEVEEDQLLKLWEGLGYYSRARNLQKAARRVMADFGGELTGLDRVHDRLHVRARARAQHAQFKFLHGHYPFF